MVHFAELILKVTHSIAFVESDLALAVKHHSAVIAAVSGSLTIADNATAMILGDLLADVRRVQSRLLTLGVR